MLTTCPLVHSGGHCPSVARLTESIESGSKSQLSVEHVENIGPHYARTLRVWREVFLAKFDEKLASYPKFMPEKQGGVLGGWLAGSTSEKPQRFYSEEVVGRELGVAALFTSIISAAHLTQFKRKWLYYFTYCEAGFATRSIGNVQMVLTRPNNMLFIKGQENVML